MNNKDEVLKLVQKGSISPQEGLRMIENTFSSLADIEDEEQRVSLPTGFETMDRFHYFSTHKPDLLVLGGRPGIGKTAMLMQICTNVSRVGRVGVFSLEMTKYQLKGRLVKAKYDLKDTNLVIDDTPGLDINQMCSRARTLAKEGAILFAIDYMQIVPAGPGTKKDKIDEVCEKLKTLAKDINRPILVAAQLSRELEKLSRDPDVRAVEPVMSDFGDSAGIERWADGAFILFKDKKVHSGNEVGFYAVKYRHGESKNIVLTFNGVRFYEEDF